MTKPTKPTKPSGLTQEEQEILERLERDKAKRDEVPEEQRVPVSQPGKFAFPIGFDDKGNKFPPPQRISEDGGEPTEEPRK